MGKDDDRDKEQHVESTQSESSLARELVVCILREVDTANAHTADLREALTIGDRIRITTIKAAIHKAWNDAQDAITKLERVSRRSEVIARAALLQSQESARDAFDELWRMVKASTNTIETAVAKKGT